MISCLICATVLIVVLLAVRPLLKRTPARLRYALWGLVLLRLALPFPLLSSGWSVMNVVDTPQSPAATAPVGLEEPASGNVYLESTGEEVPTIDTAAVIGPSQSPAATALPEESKGDQAVTGSVRSPEPLHIIRAIWLAGSIVVGAWFVIGNAIFARYLRKTREYYGKYAKLPVYQVDHIASPCLAGLLRPAIYITPEVAARPDMRAHVLAHEAAHFRHGDYIWSIARGLCLTAYWFHPLVWVAAWLSRRDCELACDETALRNMTQPERIAYGRTLLALVSAQKASPLRVATTMTAGKREMKDRVRAIAERRKTVVAALVAALLITAVAVGCTFTGAKTKESTVPMVRFSVDGTRYTPQRGTTSWNSERESFEACGIHPLAWDEALWAESTVEHDATHTRLEFDFDEPAEAILRAWPIGAPTNAAPVWEQGTVNADRYWTVMVQSGMVYELELHWPDVDGGSGTAHYGIRVVNEEPELISPFDLKLLYADDERVAFMGPFGLCVYDLKAEELLGYCDLREYLGMNVCGALREPLINKEGRVSNAGVVLEGITTKDHRVAVHLRWIWYAHNAELLHLDTEKTVYMDLQTGEVSLGLWDESIRLDTGLQEAFDLLGQGQIDFYTTEAIPFADGTYGYIAVGGTADAYPLDGLFYARGDQRWDLHLDLAERGEENQAEQAFFARFDEIDAESMLQYLDQHPARIANGWDRIDLNAAGLTDEGTGIYTKQGDEVLAIDAANGILLVRVSGEQYRGVLAIVKDAAQVSLRAADTLGSEGAYCADIAGDALLAINASGYYNLEGNGNGGTLIGYAMHSGEAVGTPAGDGYQRVELHSDNRLYIVDSSDPVNPATRDAMEWNAPLLINGVVQDNGATEIHPRSAIGQTAAGEMIFYIAEGRLPEEDIFGATGEDVLGDLQRYGCTQAMLQDGGSSAIMVYRGEEITRCSNRESQGRLLPNAWVVLPRN